MLGKEQAGVSQAAFALQDLDCKAFLALITCQGFNPLNETHLFRRVVRDVLVEVK